MKLRYIHVLILVAACGANPALDEDADELQALLHDEPLTQLTSVAPRTATSPASLRQPPTFVTRGRWTFDDCEAGRAELSNFNALENIAYRSVGVTCAPGVIGQGVAIAAREDIVYVPDQPYFTFEGGVTVGGWFQPNDLGSTQTLFRKRDRGGSSFALVLHRGRFRFVVDLGDGRAASVAAPHLAQRGVFQHVTATYDGLALRLYLDGEQVAVREVEGSIAPGRGPLLMGNDGSERRFDGVIDDLVFDLRALSASEVPQLTCIPVEPLVVATPPVSEPTDPDVTVSFDIAVTNQNPAACVPMSFGFFASSLGNIVLDQQSTIQSSGPVPGGSTTHFTIAATPFDAAQTGPVPVNFAVLALDWDFGFTSSVDVVVKPPTGCQVIKSRELLIVDQSVVHDPIRSFPRSGALDPRTGVWSFKHLVEQLASTPEDAPALVEDMLRTYATPQVINGFTVAPRSNVHMLDTWPRTPFGRLDLDRAPFELRAIASRLDLRDLAHGDAGQVNFIFGFTDPGGLIADGTLMFEYKLPASTEADVLAWAQAFHALGARPFSESYNAALQAITERIVRRGARPDRVNGSALHAVRSNESSFEFLSGSEMRSFTLSAATGRLMPLALDGTPDLSFNESSALVDFIHANRDAIVAGTHVVPAQLDGKPFRAGAVANTESEVWRVSGVDAEARHDFALATCNGCHSPHETGTLFQQVGPFGLETLSPFLRGGTISVEGVPRTFNDLRRRAEDLASLVCPTVDASGAVSPPPGSLRQGIRRVH